MSICTDDGSEVIEGCNGGKFKELGGCTDDESEEARGYADGGFEEIGT